MELPIRAQGDIILPAGEMTDIRQRLRTLAAQHDLKSVIACAFDHRTRILPFILADMKMAPAGVRAIGSAMVDSGFEKTRIVLQQWNRNFRPSQMRLDGQIPDLFLVSSMHLHSAECDRLIQDACQIDPARRPLIIAGGPRIIYEPWTVFSDNPECPVGADLAVTGEEYVFLNLLEVLLTERAGNESLRATFLRARDSGALDQVPGLVYGRSSTPEGPTEELIDTGIQRLVGDLDELPHPVLGYRLLEPPSRLATLGAHPLPSNRVRKHSLVSSIVLTMGCKFRCSYCPIPAYNQRQNRAKSGERVVDEMRKISGEFGIIAFFGTDDNFLNNTARAMDIAESLARERRKGQRPLCKVRWATEATIHDSLRMREHLPEIRQAGLVAFWLGVEDITGTLVKKGQSEDKTLEAFRVLRQSGIHPVPMMMHHDTQPLVTRKSNYGLLNQMRVLRKAGALNVQVLMLTPSMGSKWYAETYTSGLAFAKVDGKPIEHARVDGNYVVASKHPRPWLKQLYLLAAYTYFFNPVRFGLALIRSKSAIPHTTTDTRPHADIAAYTWGQRIRRRIYLRLRAHSIDAGLQMFGMYGLFHTYRRTLPWAWKLFWRKIEHSSATPTTRIPMRDAQGGPASHALPNTPTHEHVPDALVTLTPPSDKAAA
jgi:radical SAM superfamily enzyme YgiQ (UPF0313 family)